MEGFLTAKTGADPLKAPLPHPFSLQPKSYIPPRLAGGTMPFMRRYTTIWP